MKFSDLKVTLAGLLAMTAGLAPAQVVYTTDFETDQSANFAVVPGAITTPDFTVDWAYDYSTYAAAYVDGANTPTPASIAQAPNTPGTVSTRRGVRITANGDATVGDIAGVTLYLTAAGTVDLPNYILKFDAFSVFAGTGDAGGGTATGVGTTQVFGAGHAAGTTAALWPGLAADAAFAPLNGFFWVATFDGGSGTDYRLYTATTSSGTGEPGREDALMNWGGVNAVNGSNAFWTTLFPSPSHQQAGSPGKTWTTWEMVKSGTSITVFVTPTVGAQAGVRTQVGALELTASTRSLPANGTVGITVFDPFTGATSFPNDQFFLLDNLSLEIPAVPTASNDWLLFE